MHPFYNLMTDRLRRSLEFANDFAKRRDHFVLTDAHILWGMIEERRNTAHIILKNLNVNLLEFQKEIEFCLPRRNKLVVQTVVPYSRESQKTICYSIDEGLKKGYTGCHDMLLGILNNPETEASRLLGNADVTTELVLAQIAAIVKPVAAILIPEPMDIEELFD